MSRKLFLASSALATLLILPTAAYVTFGIVGDRPIVLPDAVMIESEPVGADLPLERPKTVSTVAERTQPGEMQAAAPADADTTDLTSETAETEVAPIVAAEPARARPTGVATRKEQALGTLAEGDILGEPRARLPEGSGDRFTPSESNPVRSVLSEPVSTFSVDVDTASYAYARRAIMNGMLPEADSVRVEEMINYFPYDWRGPDSADEPFKASVAVVPTPWNADTRLMHVAIKGYDLQPARQPPANLVFLIDVSGSMNEPDKLPLLKSAFRLLVNTLRPEDTVSIVVYAGASGTVLEPTRVAEKRKILDAIDNLSAGGSTAGAEGIEAAYRLAERAFRKDGVNRIMLATDGDFNVGPSSDEELKRLIEAKRRSGIFLSVLGFGSGNYNDGLMQTLAQNGNGIAAYIDSLSEAQKTLVEEATRSLFPIARDVKLQVEFNPARIAEYRLVGYETRILKREDFNDDRIDAGEIGSGHSVTAIYEVTLVGSPAILNDDLRYAAKQLPEPKAVQNPAEATDELAYVKIRYKKPDEDKSKLIALPVTQAMTVKTIDAAPGDVRFSIAVAAFAQKLKGEPRLSGYGWDAIAALGLGSKGEDRFGYRAEFLKIVDLVSGLKGD